MSRVKGVARSEAIRNIHWSDNTYRALKARAWDLDVPVSKLIKDVTEAWLALTSDWDDPLFHRGLPIEPVPLPAEPYADYLIKIGFVEGV